MKGKTPLQKKHPRCYSLDTLPLSPSTLTLFSFNKTCSSVDTILAAGEQNIVGCRARFISGRPNLVSCPETSLKLSHYPILGRRNEMARLPLTEQEVSATKVVIKFGKVGLTEEQFWQLCRDNGDLQMELSTQKELIIMPPVGVKTGWRENILTTRLTVWAEKDGTGIVCGPDTLFRLPNTAFRGPDAAWIRKERLEAFTDEELEKFGQFCPDF